MRLLPVFAAAGLLSLTACSSDDTPGGSSSGSSGTSSGSSGSSTAIAFDACTVLTQTEAQDVIAYLLTPCRKETVNDAVRHVFASPSDAPIAATGSVNVTVEQKGKNFEAMKSVCGGSGSGCITLAGVGNDAFLDLKLTGVTVKKGDAVFTARCENPGAIQAAEDAVVQDELTKENKMADLSVRTDGSLWRNSTSCSLAIAKIVVAKLP